MSSWELPETATIGERVYEIRSDFRAVLDVLKVAGDPDLTDRERGALALEIFYPDIGSMPREDYKEAGEYVRWFVSGGDLDAKPPRRKLADWEQDFPIIVGPVNRVLGYESRSAAHLHWWTFLGAYMEVGDCLFAQVVSIRKKRAEGKKLEKHERQFYRENRSIVDLRIPESDAEKQILDEWMGGATDGRQ